MKLAIMQPYLFSYIGYFQLIHAVDKFVIYDDVNFIKQGWINRNNILVQGNSLLFTVPLNNSSSFSKINDVGVNDKFYEQWKNKFIRTLEQSYRKAPEFNAIFALVNDVLTINQEITISELATKSIKAICKYLTINTEIIDTSAKYCNQLLSGKDRVIDICRLEGANQYINPIGGVDLYDKDVFKEHSIKLNFIQSLPISYIQKTDKFVPWLSIIDVIMNNSVEETRLLLSKYELV